MKKIFVFVLSLFACACVNASTKGLFERNSSDFWLNHIRSYTTYPYLPYNAETCDLSEQVLEEKNIPTHKYQRNVVVSANIGQRMVDSETFHVKNYTNHNIVAQADGVVTNIVDEIHIKKGQEFVPLGELRIDDKYYMLIEADSRGGILLVDGDGYILDKINAIYKGELLLSNTHATVSPNNLRITSDAISRMDVSGKKNNFKIIFNGASDDYFDLIYIDYTNSNIGDAKKFTYAKSAKYIDINGVKMEITGVYPDRIEYKLLD